MKRTTYSTRRHHFHQGNPRAVNVLLRHKRTPDLRVFVIHVILCLCFIVTEGALYFYVNVHNKHVSHKHMVVLISCK